MTDPRPVSELVDRVGRTMAKQVTPSPTSYVEIAEAEPTAADLDAYRSRRWHAVAPAKFRHAHVDELDSEIVDLVRGWISTPDPRPNLLLVGPVGTGKTHAACAAVRGDVEAGATAVIASVVDVLDALRAEMQPGAPSGYLDRLAVADLLLLDDLGAERPSEWAGERLNALIDRRWRDDRPVVATTNLEPKPLAAVLGERTYSRLIGGATALRISGVDRRRNPRKQER